MNKRLILLLLLPCLHLPAWARVMSVNGPDVLTASPKTVNFTTAPKATVIVFLSAKCPCSASHEELLRGYAQKHPDFQFVGIHSNADETTEEARKHFDEVQLPFPVLSDMKSHWANHWGALKTPHVFVINKTGDTVYQGGVTDSHVGPSAKKHFLEDVLEDLASNRPSRHKEGRALGCYIARAEEP